MTFDASLPYQAFANGVWYSAYTFRDLVALIPEPQCTNVDCWDLDCNTTHHEPCPCGIDHPDLEDLPF